MLNNTNFDRLSVDNYSCDKEGSAGEGQALSVITISDDRYAPRYAKGDEVWFSEQVLDDKDCYVRCVDGKEFFGRLESCSEEKIIIRTWHKSGLGSPRSISAKGTLIRGIVWIGTGN